MTSQELMQRIAGRDARYAALLPEGVEPILPADGKIIPSPRMPLPLLRSRCPKLGERLPGPCGAAIYRCNHDGIVCTTFAVCKDAQRNCQTCPHHPEAQPARLTWISTAQLAADSVLLASHVPHNAAGIVGIPRSGMIPAAIVATQLQLPLWELNEDGALRQLGHGSRGRGDKLHSGNGPLVVLDDTVYSGNAIERARASVKGISVMCGAVYVNPYARRSVQLYAKLLPSPHLLQWNMFNNGPFAGLAANPIYGAGVATDLDGILCHDNESGGAPGSPYLVPRRHRCKLIITGRKESTRVETEAWLRRWGVAFDKLVMLPDNVPFTIEAAASHKARHYAASGCGFYVESCPVQAERIFRASGKPVICPILSKVWQPGDL